MNLHFRALTNTWNTIDRLPTLAERLAQVGFHLPGRAQRHLFHRRHCARGEGGQDVVAEEKVFMENRGDADSP